MHYRYFTLTAYTYNFLIIMIHISLSLNRYILCLRNKLVVNLYTILVNSKLAQNTLGVPAIFFTVSVVLLTYK